MLRSLAERLSRNVVLRRRLGLGIQPVDQALIRRHVHTVLTASELMRKPSLHCAPLTFVADSLYVSARRNTTVRQA